MFPHVRAIVFCSILLLFLSQSTAAHTLQRQFEVPGVPQIDQYAEGLPTGCELTSATMLLQWLFNSTSRPSPRQVALIVDREPLPAHNATLPGRPLTGGNPLRAMVGDPFDPSGFGMFHSAMVKLLNQRQLLGGSPWQPVDHSGRSLHDLLHIVATSETPMITWTTLKQREPRVTDRWLDYKDVTQEVVWKSPEHAVLLVGYDLDAGVVLVNDPDTGRKERYDLDTFARRYESIGMQAVSVQRRT